MDALRLGLPRGFNIPSLPEGSLLNSPMRLFLASGVCQQQHSFPPVPECILCCPVASRLQERELVSLVAGCITSLVGLLLSFTLNEFSAPAPPKRTQSEALDPSVGACLCLFGAAWKLEAGAAALTLPACVCVHTLLAEMAELRAPCCPLPQQVHSERTDTSAELELPPSPEMPLLGAGSGNSSAAKAEGPRHRPHSGGVADAAAGGEGGEAAGEAGAAQPHTQQQSQPAGGRRQSLAELWAGVRFVLSSRG